LIIEPETFAYVLKCNGLSLNLQTEISSNNLFHELRSNEPDHARSINILKMINGQQFQTAFWLASDACHIGYLSILLRYKQELGINIHEMDADRNFIALHYISKSHAPADKKLAALELFRKSHQDNKPEPDSLLAARPGVR
jgi:hypothetical protein